MNDEGIRLESVFGIRRRDILMSWQVRLKMFLETIGSIAKNYGDVDKYCFRTLCQARALMNVAAIQNFRNRIACSVKFLRQSTENGYLATIIRLISFYIKNGF